MRKFLFLVAFGFFIQNVSKAQLPFLGYTEKQIREENLQVYSDFFFQKGEYENETILTCYTRKTFTLYYFKKGQTRNYLCKQIIEDRSLAKLYIDQIKEKLQKVAPNIYYDQFHGMYVKYEITSLGANFVWTWDYPEE
jgi:hypothetical protein